MRDTRLSKPRHVSNSILIENSRWDPITGTASAIVGAYAGMAGGAADIVTKPVAALRAPKSKNAVPDAVPVGPGQMTPTASESALVGTPQSDASRGSGRGCISTGGKVARGVASGVGSVLHNFAKGNLIDMPLAFTEGMRNAPRLYGGKVADYGPVTDWKSGLVVSGKTFGNGIGQGFAGVVHEPVRGAQQDGAMGAVKGVGKGLLGLCTGVSAAAMGVVAYPGWGIYQSIHRSIHTKTRDRIVAARLAEARYESGLMKDPEVERLVVERFDALFRR